MISLGSSTNSKGFTLVELLIVVIILAILAAIIVPQFTAATDDANQSAYDTNVANIRAAVDLYRQQHNAYPGAVEATAATCPGASSNVTAAVGAAAFDAQLRNYTNAAGQACTGTNATFRYGPYLKDAVPNNPLGSPATSTVTVVTAGTLGLTSTGTTEGWIFDSVTGEFVGDH
jgi:general secretion pathway protein G